MPIFEKQLQRVDPSNPQEAIKKMYQHIKYMQEQMEYTLMNLDSRNIIEIDTDKTTITDSTGNAATIGSYISLKGQNGESFTAGQNSKGNFEFAVKDKKGNSAIYLNGSGELIITDYTTLTIDGGEW